MPYSDPTYEPARGLVAEQQARFDGEVEKWASKLIPVIDRGLQLVQAGRTEELPGSRWYNRVTYSMRAWTMVNGSGFVQVSFYGVKARRLEERLRRHYEPTRKVTGRDDGPNDYQIMVEPPGSSISWKV